MLFYINIFFFLVDKDFEWVGDPQKIFSFDKQIGEGGFGVVFKVTQNDTKNKFAVKIMKVDASNKILIKNEIDILKKCRDKNLVCYYGCLAQVRRFFW